MNDIIAKMRGELRQICKESVADYPGKPRDKYEAHPVALRALHNGFLHCTGSPLP